MTEKNESQLWARTSERPFLRRVAEWVTRVEQKTIWHLTDFLTTREQLLLGSYVGGKGICVEFFGGHVEAERKRALIIPDMWFPDASDYHVVTLEIQSVTNEVLSHGSILGAMLGTGLDRRKTGDIWSNGSKSYVMVTEEVSKFLLSEWNSVGRLTIHVALAELGTQFAAPSYEPAFISIASMRIDAVVAAACHYSRSDAQTSIERGQVSLNHVEVSKTDELVEVGDVISVRGFGRIRLISIPGKTKKDRYRVNVGVLRSSHR